MIRSILSGPKCQQIQVVAGTAQVLIFLFKKLLPRPHFIIVF